MSDFVVQGPESDDRDNSELKTDFTQRKNNLINSVISLVWRYRTRADERIMLTPRVVGLLSTGGPKGWPGYAVAYPKRPTPAHSRACNRPAPSQPQQAEACRRSGKEKKERRGL